MLFPGVRSFRLSEWGRGPWKKTVPSRVERKLRLELRVGHYL